jgi:polysaccharide biosynthesis protein PslH
MSATRGFDGFSRGFAIGSCIKDVVPLRIGSGTRLMIFEAMFMGNANVSTTIRCEELEVEHGKNIIIADNSVDFAHNVLLLLRNEETCHAPGIAARKLVEEKHSWKSIEVDIRELIQRAG